MKLTPQQQDVLAHAVTSAEAHTSAEIVLVILPRSRAYVGVPGLVAGLGAYLSLAYILFADEIEVDAIHVLPTVAVLAAGLFALANMVPLGWISTHQARKQAVDTQAHAAFSRHGVYRTGERTGMLVFISADEGEARLLFDRGLVDAVPQDVREDWRVTFETLARNLNVDVLVPALEELGKRAGAYLPRRADDVDELPNMPRGEGAAS